MIERIARFLEARRADDETVELMKKERAKLKAATSRLLDETSKRLNKGGGHDVELSE